MVKQTTSRWSAVAISPGSSSCEAASALKGKRFLSAEAPRLPLTECTAQDTCRCVYRKYPDRRAGPRRAEDHDGVRRAGSGGARRRGTGVGLTPPPLYPLLIQEGISLNSPPLKGSPLKAEEWSNFS